MITVDLETKSYANLKQVGQWVYSEDPTTDVICVCWGFENNDIEAWWPGMELPEHLFEMIRDGAPVEAHNVAFERSIWTNILAPRYGWPLPADDQWRDTMAAAAYYALPMALDKLANVLGYEGKDPDGARLITKYSKLYLKTAKAEIPDEDFRRFVDYCKRDVMIEQSVSDFLGDLPEREVPWFHLSHKINMRGLHLDIAGIEAAGRIVDQRSEQLAKEFQGITGLNPTQTEKVRLWFGGQGIELANMQAATIEEVIKADVEAREERRNDTLPALPLKALEIRLAINKASTKKLDAMARQRGSDGRARFQTRYHGALTGRETGSGFQPLNLVRSWEHVEPARLVDDIMFEDAEWLDCIYGDAMQAVSKAGRHWIMAEEGNYIIAGDFASIEAVVGACLAGEEWKVEAFRRREAIYERMAERIYNLPVGTVTKKTHPLERQDGKTGELAFGFQGALGAWLKFDSSGRHTDERIIEICKAWRSEHPAIVNTWYRLQRQAIEAVEYPGRTTGYREIGFQVVDDWLSMILPNGKRTWYWKPQLRTGMPQWHKPAEKEDCAAGTCNCEPEAKLTYESQKGGRWKRVYTYGGKLFENACQATSREILMPAAQRAENAGYPVVLTVYDEIIAEPRKGFGSIEEFEELMRGPLPDWCADWPVNVEAWQGLRYKK